MFFLGMVFAPWAAYRGHMTLAVVLWCLAVVGRLVGAVRPQWMKPVFIGMTIVALPIGWVVSHAAMALIYYGVFTPVALFFRLIGRDALQRQFDRAATTYWEEHNPNHGMKRYLRQF